MIKKALQGMLCIDFDGTITKYKNPLPKTTPILLEDLNYPNLLKELFIVCQQQQWPCYIVTQNQDLEQILQVLNLLFPNKFNNYFAAIYYGNEIGKIDKITQITKATPDEKYYYPIAQLEKLKFNKIIFVDDQEENQLLDEEHELFKIMNFIEVTHNADFIYETIKQISDIDYVKPIKKLSFELKNPPPRKKSKETEQHEESTSDVQFQL
jgi:hypothetical protein